VADTTVFVEIREVTVSPSELVVVISTVVGTDVLVGVSSVVCCVVPSPPSSVVVLSSVVGGLLVVGGSLVVGGVDGVVSGVEVGVLLVTPVPTTCLFAGITPSGILSAWMVAKEKKKPSMIALTGALRATIGI
jgi:hypothetical protein